MTLIIWFNFSLENQPDAGNAYKNLTHLIVKGVISRVFFFSSFLLRCKGQKWFHSSSSAHSTNMVMLRDFQSTESQIKSKSFMHIYYVQRLSVSKVIEVSQVLPHSISKRFCEWTKIRIFNVRGTTSKGSTKFEMRTSNLLMYLKTIQISILMM